MSFGLPVDPDVMLDVLSDDEVARYGSELIDELRDWAVRQNDRWLEGQLPRVQRLMEEWRGRSDRNLLEDDT